MSKDGESGRVGAVLRKRELAGKKLIRSWFIKCDSTSLCTLNKFSSPSPLNGFPLNPFHYYANLYLYTSFDI